MDAVQPVGGYPFDGVVTRIGDAPLIKVAGVGEMRFAYRNIRRRAREPRVVVAVGDVFRVQLKKDGRVAALRAAMRMTRTGCLVVDESDEEGFSLAQA